MTTSIPPLLLPLTIASLLFLTYHSVEVVAAAKLDRNISHGHNGKLPPYTPGPFSIVSLTPSDETLLSKGKPVMKQIPYTPEDNMGEGGRAICVQDVDAPKPAVWNQILGLDEYVGKVKKLNICKNYFVEKEGEDGAVRIKTKMVIGVLPGFSYENYYNHRYTPASNSMTWQLDYDKTSDFDDVSGHWHVEDHPQKAGTSRVFYACDVTFKQRMPKAVMSYVNKSALKLATGWVKRESEGRKDACVPDAFLPDVVTE